MLKIEKLSVLVDNKQVLKDFNLFDRSVLDMDYEESNQIQVKANLDILDGSVHVIMGPNGVGKSTLSRVIMGDKNYKIIEGKITYNGEIINNMTPDIRSKMGIFLAMQNPLEIDGVSNQDFLRTAMSNRDGKKVGLYDFILKCESALDELKMDKSLIHRSLNVGFSGGEKKKNEVLQMKLLKPSFIILDELDSGLDVDSIKIVADNINMYKKENPNVSILIITHLTKILSYIKPDYVHVLYDGKIVDTGSYDLAKEIDKFGYNKYLNKSNIIADGENHE